MYCKKTILCIITNFKLQLNHFIMKKLFKILLIIILFLVVALFTAPLLFKGKIIKLANEQLEKNLNARASFSNINISLIRNFPNLSIRVENLNVSGISEFEGDTLLSIKAIELAVDLISAIKMEDIKIKRISIDQPYINAIVLKDGKANWDITKESAAEAPADTTPSEFNTKISLKLFKISDANIRYTDYSSDMSASLGNLNFTLTGDLSKDNSLIVIDSKIEKVNFIMSGVRYVKNALLQMHFDVDANLKESTYVFKENRISLNDLSLGFDGSVQMPASGDIITNMTFSTKNTDFKTLLSLVPAIYMKDFTDLKTTGSLKLEGKITGAVTKTATPNVDAKLVVKDAALSYPDLPKSMNNIQIDVDLHYDGVQMDNTTVDVNKFHVELGGNPIDMTLNLRNPISDPFTSGKLIANVDLGNLSDIIPLDSTEIKGLIKANLDWMGKYSSIQNEKYEDFKADGIIAVNNFYYTSPDLPKAFSLPQAQMSFSPKQITLSSFDAKLGASDFRLQGKLTNYIPYILKNEVVKGELALNSTRIDLNEFMSEEETSATDTTPLSVIEVPGNIDFRLLSSIGKLLYDKLIISSITGVVIVKDSRVVMENLKMNMLDGSIALSGEYNTKDIKNPVVDFKFDAKNIDIPMAVNAFGTLVKVAPIASKATGKVSVDMTFSSLLGQDMSPVMKSIVGEGNLTSNQIGLKGSNTMNKIGQALKTDAFNNMVLKNINIKFEILNGSLIVKPSEIKLADATLLIAGEQSFENTLNYGININAPRKMLGLDNATVDNLYASAASKGLNIPKSEIVNLMAKVTGTITDPKVSLDLKENLKQSTQAIKEELKQNVKQVIETKKEVVKVQAKAEADKILKEAEKQAATIKADAKKAADVVRAESNTNADKLLREATNPITKAAAKPTADKMRSEGEKKAQQLENEANTRANKILQDARTKSNNLLK
jgi:hypothetical protein